MARRHEQYGDLLGWRLRHQAFAGPSRHRSLTCAYSNPCSPRREQFSPDRPSAWPGCSVLFLGGGMSLEFVTILARIVVLVVIPAFLMGSTMRRAVIRLPLLVGMTRRAGLVGVAPVTRRAHGASP